MLGSQKPQAPVATGNRDEDLQNLANAITDLQDIVDRKEDKTEAIRKYEDLLDRLKNVKPAGPDGPKVSGDEIAKWNAAADTAKENEDAIKELRREFSNLNADKLRSDINNINGQLANFVQYDDFKR